MMDVREVDINSIKPYPKNPRINDDAVQYVAESIKQFGFQQPIVVDKDGIIIVGHTRYKAAKKLGHAKVPVLFADMSEEKAAAYRLADNKTNEFASWDFDLLSSELDSILDIDMTTLGFDFEDKHEVVEDDYEPDPPAEPQAKYGDIYQLGRHRLMCGDSTLQSDIEKLCGDQKMDMLLTDPPYNVDYTGGTKDALKIMNDSMESDKFRLFLRDAFVGARTVLSRGGCVSHLVWRERGIQLPWRLRRRRADCKAAARLGEVAGHDRPTGFPAYVRVGDYRRFIP